MWRLYTCHHAGADSFRVSTLAGSGSSGGANGVGAAATFANSYSVAVDSSGIAYIAEMGNRVRQIVVSTGVVTTLAGSPVGTAGSADGTGTSATFSSPRYVALDGLGNLYLTDFDSHCIRKVVLATQAVTTVAGSGTAGAANGVGVAASFNNPHGIACDTRGNAYVTDDSNHLIRKIVLSSATVTTLAGTGSASSANGVGTSAGFSRPVSVAVDSSGTLLFVADYHTRLIRQIVIATQTVTTLAGSGASGSANGVGVAAQFGGPHCVALDLSGNLYVGDIGSQLVRKIVIATQVVTTVTGTGSASWADGIGTNAAFHSPIGLAVDARGFILVAESSNQRVRVLQPAVTCTEGFYCAAGADRIACASCAAGSSAPPLATATHTTDAWTVGENAAGVVPYKCVTQALGVSASLAFSAMSIRVERGVFTAAAYASSAQPGGSQQGTWLYQGCFVDSLSRLLPVRLAASVGPTDAALSCMALARAAGYSVVGMEAWGPPNGDCWGLPPDEVSHWRLAPLNEAECGDGDVLLPSGMRWGNTAGFGIAIYHFHLPVAVAGQAYGLISPGYLTAYPNDYFTWSVAFPSSTTASVCAALHGWGDHTLKGLTVTPCPQLYQLRFVACIASSDNREWPVILKPYFPACFPAHSVISSALGCSPLSGSLCQPTWCCSSPIAPPASM